MMSRGFKWFHQTLCILIALMQVVLPLFFIIYNSINQDPDVMKKMTVLIIVIESLSFLYLLLTNNIS